VFKDYQLALSSQLQIQMTHKHVKFLTENPSRCRENCK